MTAPEPLIPPLSQERNDINEIYLMVANITYVQQGHTHQFTNLRRVLKEHDKRFDAVDRRFDGLEGRFDGLEGRFDGLEGRFDGLEVKVDGLADKVDEILRRLAS